MLTFEYISYLETPISRSLVVMSCFAHGRFHVRKCKLPGATTSGGNAGSPGPFHVQVDEQRRVDVASDKTNSMMNSHVCQDSCYGQRANSLAYDRFGNAGVHSYQFKSALSISSNAILRNWLHMWWYTCTAGRYVIMTSFRNGLPL